jgi:SdrD B-like domain/GEVED domain
MDLRAVTTDGSLRMEVITAYNFVVDSNVESPSTNGPSAAHLGVKIYNDGPTALTGVYVNIGKLTNPLTSAGTPGIFETRVNPQGYTGTFALQMPGGPADAVRYIPRIEPGQYVSQYFFVTYPLKDDLGNSVAGAAPVTEDDLWLNYDIWASAQEGATTRRVDKTTKVTMRNEISAMANKIWPNTDGKVPNVYLDAIQNSLGWRPDTSNSRISGAVVMEGIWYDLGNVGAGFDNNGDGLPDRNAWLQPAGNPATFSPLAARLVKCYGIVIVKLNDGTEQLIPFEDQLYFENIPSNNTGAVGLVYYEFIPLDSSKPSQLTPYQEVASGYDNEKFNGDYGAAVGSVSGTPPLVAFDKSGPVNVAGGSNATYVLSATNNETTKKFGWPELGLPLIFQDSIPANLIYVAGSATTANSPPAGLTYEVSWSTDGGVTWVSTEPAAASVTGIRWTLSGALAAGQTAAVSFQASVPTNYPGAIVSNTGCLNVGPDSNFACDTATTLVSGLNSLGDFIWRDLDRDGVQDGGAETGIANIGVTLYYDANGDGVLDSTDPLYGTTQTNASGIYGFSNLPDGRFLVVVDQNDADLPTGYSLPTSTTTLRSVSLDPTSISLSAVSVLTADWPFIPALSVVKSVTPTTYGAGDLITYTIDLENNSAPVAAKTTPVQTSWSTTVTGDRPAQNAANAQGFPDTSYARLDQTAAADGLTNSGLSFADQTGSITKVELVFNGYLAQALVDDRMDVSIGGVLFTTLTTAQLNAMTGPAAIRSIDITSKNASWTWPLVNALTGNLKTNKTSAGDPGILWVDSIGFRVTTSAAPAPTGSYGPSTMAPLPLVDTYDSTKLQYVSASVAPTSVAAGTITWSNLGPLNAGARQTITVTFLALSPPDTNANGEPDPTTTINTATSANAYFVSGRPTNPATGTATVTINPRGSIGDRVWWDLNANGTQDSGEPGLANVLVTLSNGAQTTTDANGNYLFSGLVNGTYDVTISTATLPWGTFTRTFDPDNSVANQRDDISTVTINTTDGLSTNDFYVNQDFGYDSTLNVISGSIFQDNDGDGIQDPGENFLAGVTVTLSSGATTTTDANGFYRFGSLANGTYTVTVTQPGSTTQTLDPDGAVMNNATTVVASGGNLYDNRNFAYQPTGTLTLGDTLYFDWNGNGIQDSGEQGIPNVDVFLYEDSNGNGVIDAATDSLIGTSVTNASGVYGFSNLLAGNYLVVVNTTDPQFPAGVTQIQDFDGVIDSKAKVNLTVSLATVDFGYQPVGTGAIGNLVWLDADNDGIKDASESGINGVTVELYRSGQTPGVDTPYATTTTSGGGLYSFTNLPAESYTIYFPASNFTTGNALAGTPLSSTTTVTTDNTVDNDDNGSQSASGAAVSSPVIVLSSGETDDTKDFGFVGVGTVGDFVFYDANANGEQDFSETGIANVTVRIFLDADGDGVADSPTPVATTVTADGSGANPAGFYRFENLTPGIYIVQVDTTSPALVGLPQTTDPDFDGVPANPSTNPGDNADSLVIVSSGSSYSGADFGYQPPGAIGDFVWLDLDQDGVQDAGEPGLAGVSIQISNGTTTYTVTTDPNGYWSSVLPDGNWTVSIPASNFTSGNPLENLAASYDANGVGTPNTVSLTITAGVVNLPVGNLGIDFGYKLNGIYGLSGTIAIHDTGLPGTADDTDDFFDDGVDLDAGPLDETELSGVEVFLYTSDGDFLGSTFTDANGDYAFSGLASGSYRVIIGTTAAPLDLSVLTTTTANNLSGSTVSSTSTSVTQLLTIGTSSVVNVDFTFNSTVDYDFGDLPSIYGMTTLAQDGARHIIPTGGSTLYLGTAPDADTNGLPTALGNGDDSFGSDDENGVTLISPANWTNGTVGTGNGGDIQVNVTGSGWLVGWVDWNHDGDFLDSGEFIVSQAVSTGTSAISFDIPAGTIGTTSESWLSRFRVFTSEPAFPLFSYEGVATDGEVEDYLIEKPLGGSIGDLVWNDADGDGVIDAGEDGIGGRVVELRDSLNVLVATQTTGTGTNDVDGDGVIDPLGYYRFRDLAAGTYTVTVTNPPAGFDPSFDENGIGTANVTSVTLATDAQHLTADFGYEPQVANISGQVRYDTDGDGDPNDVDSGAMVVKIQLWSDPNGDGDPADGQQVGETYTDASGNYIFTNVPSGSYVVVEINTPGSTSTYDVAGANDDRIPVVMVGNNVTGRDFLDTLPPLHAISGTVYDDNDATNDNVIGAGDTPLASITIKLFLDRDGSGTVTAGDTEISSTVTNASGSYNFTGLPAGNYVVRETDPSGATSESDAAGSPTDNEIGVTVTNANVTARDFLDDGYLGSITGTVRVDTDGNGSGDTPHGGVTLSLLDGNGDPVLGPGGVPVTTVTAPDGTYSFTNLPPGTYQVAKTTLSGYKSVSDKDGGNPDLINPVVVVSGTANTLNDFLEMLQKCPDLWADWQTKWNALGVATGLTQNPDGDRYSNLLEYAFCMPPNSGVVKPFCLVSSPSVTGAVDGVYSRTAGGAQDVTYVLEHTAALGNPTVWSSVVLNATNTVVTNNGNGTETVRIIDLETITSRTTGSGFVRIRINLNDGSTQATDTTETLGWVETAFGTCCSTYNNPFLQCATFTGTVDSVDGQDLVVTTSTGPFNLADSMQSGVSYYVEVTNGENEGRRYDVVSASGGRIILANDADIHAATAPFNTHAGPPPPDLAGDTIVMHRHHTIAGLFPPGGFGAEATQALADDLQVSAGGAWKVYWLYNNAGSPRWVDAADALNTDKGATVIPPGQGMFFNNRHAPTALLAYGEVRENDFIRPHAAGSNLVGGGYPVHQSVNATGGRAMNTGTGFFGSTDFKTADSVFVWKTDETTGATGYHTYYLLNGGPSLQRWVKVGDASLIVRDAETLLLRDRSVFVRAKNGVPQHKVPAPWIP